MKINEAENLWKLSESIKLKAKQEIISRKLSGRHRLYLIYDDLHEQFTLSFQSSKYFSFKRFQCKGFIVSPTKNGFTCTSRKAFESIFLRVIEDLYLGSFQIDPNQVEKWMLKRLKRWRSFFQNHNTPVMDEKTQKGLFGELKTLIALYEDGKKDAILYWKGPQKHQHDFVMPNESYECKVINSRYNSIRINGALQLYSDVRLTMRVYKIELKEEGESVHDLVEECEGYIPLHHEELFNELLGCYGYVSDQESVDSIIVKDIIDYSVTDGFPRLPIIPGTDEVNYKIDLSSCEDFIIY
ncbi:PD-(D/E)XK motif protein [Alkalibacillus haloalkaliphilus]|uniref:PD-(D/E)XK motif protein n=1 Tax=Alkalibacillus haloalkaliphilus TaxID=94136 RepID=UPI0029361757|nr:PD-(D/E)XK motif protein [Alkalibacillus haloalkaliphilus]MDV2581694.1 PD-(D/E)XK motif protein [Alkalibacillus haloalkaliphilus]